MDKRLREDQITFLQKIKPFLVRNHHIPMIEKKEEALEEENIDVVQELMKRIEKLERSVSGQEEAGARTVKMKERVMATLQERKKMTSSQMAEVLGLSRTRCNEYFRELMTEGKVEGVLIDRNKFYKVTKQ